MKHSPKLSVSVLLIAPLLIAMGAMLFMMYRQPSGVLAQSAKEAIGTPAMTSNVTLTAAEMQATAMLTITDFDKQIFILSPAVRPERFVNCVDNPYYPLIPGTIYTYEKESEEGLETTTVTVTNQTKQVMGIAATVVRDTVMVDGEMREDTLDWFAQDRRGNVWYLGEETAEYENGEVVSTEGSWQAGINDARPGIVMLADPIVGDFYRQEYLKDEATDMAAVLSLRESLALPKGNFDHTLMTADYNPLSGELEHKYYAPGIGIVAESRVDGSIHTRLTAIGHDSTLQTPNQDCGKTVNGVAFVGTLFVPRNATIRATLAQISASEAEQIAIDAAPRAAVAHTELAVKNGFLVYKISLDNGIEVIIDAGDAALLAISSAVDDEPDTDEGEVGEEDVDAGDATDGEAEDEASDNNGIGEDSSEVEDEDGEDDHDVGGSDVEENGQVEDEEDGAR